MPDTDEKTNQKMNPDKSDPGGARDPRTANPTPQSAPGRGGDDKGNRDPKRTSDPSTTNPAPKWPPPEEQRRGSPIGSEEDPAGQQSPKSNF